MSGGAGWPGRRRRGCPARPGRCARGWRGRGGCSRGAAGRVVEEQGGRLSGKLLHEEKVFPPSPGDWGSPVSVLCPVSSQRVFHLFFSPLLCLISLRAVEAAGVFAELLGVECQQQTPAVVKVFVVANSPVAAQACCRCVFKLGVWRACRVQWWVLLPCGFRGS